MKIISFKSLCSVVAMCVLYFGIAWLVISLTPKSNSQFFGLMFLTACLFISTSIVFIRDSPVPVKEDLDVRTLVFRALIRHLDNVSQIPEKTFIGSREPRGYVHICMTETDKSFQLFFKTTSNLRKVTRIAHSMFMSLDQCDIVNNNVSSCGMRGFEAVSEARNELYRVFVCRNKHTNHIRVYVYVQTMSQTDRMHESV